MRWSEKEWAGLKSKLLKNRRETLRTGHTAHKNILLHFSVAAMEMFCLFLKPLKNPGIEKSYKSQANLPIHKHSIKDASPNGFGRRL